MRRIYKDFTELSTLPPEKNFIASFLDAEPIKLDFDIYFFSLIDLPRIAESSSFISFFRLNEVVPKGNAKEKLFDFVDNR
jgi:hypothetical protein